MKKESGKDNNEKLEIKKTAQKKNGKGEEKQETERKRRCQASRKKFTENQKERARLCAALSLGIGTLLFSAWAFSGSEPAYMNASGYMALQNATGQEASAGVLVSEKKAGQGSRKEDNAAKKKAMSETETDTETESETESETETDMDTASETDAVEEMESGLERKDENETGADGESAVKEKEKIETEVNAAPAPEKKAETDAETEDGSERESETDREKETNPGAEGKAVMETEQEPDLGAEMEITVEAEETEREPETYQATESPEEVKEPAGGEVPSSGEESEDEKESETEITTEESTEDAIESDTENESPAETERTTECSTEETPSTDEEGESETAPENESESETESNTESSREELPSGSEESEKESETEITTEESPEDVTENSTENETEASKETEPETVVQKPETEVEKEPETEPDTKKEPETEAESEMKTEHQTEPETSPSMPEPLPVCRGEQYKIRGDENAWYRDDAGHLWVRRGSSVYVDPVKQQGYMNGSSITDVQQDGMLKFQLKKTDANGSIIGISTLQQEAYFVDGEAPEARIEPSGHLENGVIYAAQSSAVTVTVPPDGKSGLKRVSYRISSGENTSSQEETWTDWVDCKGSEQVNISGEGIYRLYVRTEDRVGNLAFSSSAPVCVDCTPPQIEIEGVQGETANSGSVPIRVKCSDSFYRPGSLEVKIVGANNGKVPKIKLSEEKKESASTEFFDFPKEKAYDDSYRLEVRAEDLAGNATQKTLDFSINRFGSVYDLSSETKEALQPYYLTEAEDIVFLEMNIDYVGESEIFCRENGELKKLNRGSDYTVELQGSSDSWKQYRYMIPAEYFEKEGVYELLLASRDRASNESDTGLQGKQVTFALDWTAPECLITGVEALGIYPEEYQTACIQPKDNLGISQTRVYCDSELVQTTEEDEAPVKLKLDAKQEWQTIQVYVKDLAGNETWSPEIPVFISSEAKEVLTYEKTRKSAQEKTEELIRRKAGYGAGGEKTVNFKEEPEKERQGKQTAEEDSMPDEAGERTEKDSLFGRTERIRRGRLLFGFGTLLFLVTFLVCILPLGKRKR